MATGSNNQYGELPTAAILSSINTLLIKGHPWLLGQVAGPGGTLNRRAYGLGDRPPSLLFSMNLDLARVSLSPRVRNVEASTTAEDG